MNIPTTPDYITNTLIEEVEKATGYKFRNVNLLIAIFCSPQFCKDKGWHENAKLLEMMEWVGDSQLEAAVRNYLFKNFKRYGLMQLTMISNYLFSNFHLAAIVKQLDLDKFVKISSIERSLSVTKSNKFYGALLERIIYGVLEDSGNDAEAVYNASINLMFRVRSPIYIEEFLQKWQGLEQLCQNEMDNGFQFAINGSGKNDYACRIRFPRLKDFVVVGPDVLEATSQAIDEARGFLLMGKGSNES